MPSPCSASSHAISVKAFQWRTRSDHMTRKASAARNNAAYGEGNGKTVVPYSPSLSLETLDTGILLLALFTLDLEMDHPSETPHRHPFSDFFLRGGGSCTTSSPGRFSLALGAPRPQSQGKAPWGRGWAAVHRLSGTDNPVFKSQADCLFKIKTIPLPN